MVMKGVGNENTRGRGTIYLIICHSSKLSMLRIIKNVYGNVYLFIPPGHQDMKQEQQEHCTGET